ncbi:beta-hydroxyacid dehydrogenase, 3-hydroxyisobutyrate dehydrogenase [Frankia torreyi]|uniref:Beta-hydroxyacid dehydrogenase, 3-hydroxyisobutyrate dehydrogenase n=3 Tax=Frankia TaxID=1854 RepID=A0A0D8B9A2_9ACTN|nr:beta-hydroxyacid dehydrogenase, 3-hydroxyisobutyrate dehydrogenase [Frankia torreyi]KQM02841.1 beta-hydroxyacid dehydrogenase, 3-hydroxyisobutyrate dehydrogenase [Frankia sp. CpI1-P]
MVEQMSPADAAGSGALSPVGFVGAGSMGAPMIERLLAADVPVHLYARRAEVRARFAGLGAVVEPSLAAVAAAAEVLIVCPFSAIQLAEIVGGPDGLLAHATPGSVVVQHATVPTAAIRQLAADAATRDVTVLDAPISGTSATILAGRLTVLIGGTAAAADRVEPLLAAYASTIVRTGEVGSATTVKLINNLTFAAHAQTAAAAVQLGEKLGIRSGDLLTAITACSADSAVFRHLQAIGGVEEFLAMAGPYLRKDVAAVEEVTAALGLDTGILGEVVQSGPLPLTASRL